VSGFQIVRETPHAGEPAGPASAVQQGMGFQMPRSPAVSYQPIPQCYTQEAQAQYWPPQDPPCPCPEYQAPPYCPPSYPTFQPPCTPYPDYPPIPSEPPCPPPVPPVAPWPPLPLPPEKPAEFYCGNVVGSIALMEAALSHVINAEGEKIQKSLEMSCSVSELLEINESVRAIMEQVRHVEEALLEKLSIACRCCGFQGGYYCGPTQEEDDCECSCHHGHGCCHEHETEGCEPEET
jgi:hypothetical protein